MASFFNIAFVNIPMFIYGGKLELVGYSVGRAFPTPDLHPGSISGTPHGPMNATRNDL